MNIIYFNIKKLKRNPNNIVRIIIHYNRMVVFLSYGGIVKPMSMKKSEHLGDGDKTHM